MGLIKGPGPDAETPMAKQSRGQFRHVAKFIAKCQRPSVSGLGGGRPGLALARRSCRQG